MMKNIFENLLLRPRLVFARRAKVLGSKTPGSTRPKLTKTYFNDFKSSIERLIWDFNLLDVDAQS